MNRIRQLIRDVPDFPKAGITFKDITPVLSDPSAMREVIDAMAEQWRGRRVDKVIGIESRGFLFASPLAYVLGAGCAVVRKPGKLPWKTIREVYALEYGTDALEMHVDALAPGERALVVDDVLATGGTAGAAGRLVTRQGAEVLGYAFVIELGFLRGADRLGLERVHALVRYD
ncbi:MAG TPA: adenine phosphoribosyltransferase [Myxococcaceae bacterium]|jgi:adenine phosphoribosyltransferase|nr:adenine phosphoribosyltransferase [Myxococcaceae bacterium]